MQTILQPVSRLHPPKKEALPLGSLFTNERSEKISLKDFILKFKDFEYFINVHYLDINKTWKKTDTVFEGVFNNNLEIISFIDIFGLNNIFLEDDDYYCDFCDVTRYGNRFNINIYNLILERS